MKRLVVLFLVCLMITASFQPLSAAADDSGFVVKDGVLLSYSGTSKELTLPDTVREVGDSAFEGNTTLTSVTIPSSVDSIGNRAFYGCSSLTSVVGGSGVAQVGVFAFNGTPYFDESNKEFFMLGKTLLWYNGNDMYITLPACVSIAPYAFLRCKTVKMVRASSGLQSVGAGAFYDCSSLSSVDLPSTVGSIGAYAFDGTPFVTSQGEFTVLGDGILVKYNGSRSDVTVPDGVRRVASHCFVSSKLTSVSLPSTVFSIDPYAFADCVGLKTIGLSSGLSMIGDGAFRGCKSLASLTAPDTVAYIGQYAFSACALESVRLMSAGLTVSNNAFNGCTSLSYALLSSGVKAVYGNAFSGCTSLSGFSVSKDTAVSSTALSGCSSVKVTTPKGSSASSALKGFKQNHIIGDSDSDGVLTILDVTAVQCQLADIKSLGGAQIAASDYDFSGDIDILDAAGVQMTLVKTK